VPFVELPVFQGGEGVGHFGDEGLGQAEEPAAFGGGFVPGQGDLRGDAGSEFGRGHPGVGLFAALEQIEGDGQACLPGSQGGLLVFQGPDFSNQAGTFVGQPSASKVTGHARDRHARRPNCARLRHCAGGLGSVCRMGCSDRLKCIGPLLAVHDQTLLLSSDIY